MKRELVFVLGASNKPTRTSNQAIKMLKEYGHKTVLINPKIDKIDGEKTFKSISEAQEAYGSPDTLTLYVKEEISDNLAESILLLKPKRIIFNPGSENLSLQLMLVQQDINFEESCTLVLLSTDQF